MAHSSTFIDGSLAISLATVNNVLNAGSTDLVTLCSYAGINKWAKYKPIDVGNQNTEITDAQRKANNYGLTCDYTAGDPTDIIKQGWAYGKRPTSTSCCRLLDFSNYKKDAVTPCWVAPCQSIIAGNSATFSVAHDEEDYTYSVKLDDLTVLSTSLLNWYPCVLISNGTTLYLVTANETVSEQGCSMPNGGYAQVTVTLGASAFPKGTYTWYPCLCDQKFTSFKTVTEVKNSGSYHFAPYPLASDDYSGSLIVTSGGGGSTGIDPGDNKTVSFYFEPHTSGSPNSSSSEIDYVNLGIGFGSQFGKATGLISVYGIEFVVDSGGEDDILGSWSGDYSFQVTNGVITKGSTSLGTWDDDKKIIIAKPTDSGTTQHCYLGRGTEIYGRAKSYAFSGSFKNADVDNDTYCWLLYPGWDDSMFD